MKTKLAVLALGLAAFSLAAYAQENTTTNVSDASTNSVEVSTNAMATDTATNVPVNDASTNAAAATITETPSAAPTFVNDSASTNATGTPVIPLIVMDDVLLTDAIKNLARQAGLNYMLDPKLAYGQPGPDGRIVPQPTVSIRWENVTAEQALAALLGNNGLQMIEDPKTKISRVTVKDPAAPEPLHTKVIQLQYTSPSNIIMSVQTTLTDKRSKVIGDIRTSQIVVLATDKEIDAVDQLVTRLDKPTKQVLIEARLLETSMNPKTVKGLDWSGTLNSQHLAFGNNLQQNPVDASLNPTLSSSLPKLLFDTAHGFSPATAFLDADGVNVVLSFLNQNAEAKVLSAPRTVTLDNETASIDVIRQIPIITISPSSANTPGSSSITYSNVGVMLQVTPRISANNMVNLRITPEVSRVFSKEIVKSGSTDNTVYTFDRRILNTSVVVPSGNTLVLGGLIQDDVRTGNTKVPGLGDLPLLGRAFRSDSKERNQNNLLIFITPTIVTDGDYQPTETSFLKEPLPQEDNKAWSPWDSGAPRDWSNLRPGKKTAE